MREGDVKERDPLDSAIKLWTIIMACRPSKYEHDHSRCGRHIQNKNPSQLQVRDVFVEILFWMVAEQRVEGVFKMVKLVTKNRAFVTFKWYTSVSPSCPTCETSSICIHSFTHRAENQRSSNQISFYGAIKGDDFFSTLHNTTENYTNKNPKCVGWSSS